jgi:hypothetical protein
MKAQELITGYGQLEGNRLCIYEIKRHGLDGWPSFHPNESLGWKVI